MTKVKILIAILFNLREERKIVRDFVDFAFSFNQATGSLFS